METRGYSAAAAAARGLAVDVVGLGGRARGRTRSRALEVAFLPVTAAALLLGTLAVQLGQVGQVSLWYDEAFSLGLAERPWSVLWHYVWGTEANMGLYYALLHLWVDLDRLLGIPVNELTVHVPSALLAGAAAVAVFLLGRWLGGNLAGAVAGGLYGLDYLQLYVAGQARSYGLQLLLVTVSWLALMRAVSGGEKRCRRWWALYAATAALAVYAHMFSGLVLVSQVVAFAVGLLLWPPLRRQVLPMLASLAGVALLVSPLLADAVLHGPPNLWLGPARPIDIVHLGGWLDGGVIPLSLVFGGGAVAALWLSRPGEERWRVVALGLGIAVPVAISFALTQRGLNLHLFLARYLVVIVPPVALLAGLGIALLRVSPSARVGIAVAAVALGAFAVPTYYRTQQRADYIRPSAWIQDHWQVGDGIVVFSRDSAVTIDHYLAGGEAPDVIPPQAPGGWDWSSGIRTPVTSAALAAYVPAHSRLMLVEDGLRKEPGEIKARSLESWLRAHGWKLQASSGTPVRVLLYSR